MACLTACPSGVRYDELIEATRAQIERNYARRPDDRLLRGLIFALFPYPSRLRTAALAGWLYQRLHGDAVLRFFGLDTWLPDRALALQSLLPDISLGELRHRTPTRTPAQGERRLTVGLLTGCVQSVFFARVNDATARVLAAEGCDVVAPPTQGCCGALGVHAGHDVLARDLARAAIATFTAAGVDVVVTNAAGCGSTMKEYGHLLRDDPVYAERAAALAAKVRDVTEVLDALPPRAPRHPIPATVAYHDACHLAHAQGVRAEPRRVLRTIPDLRLAEIAEAELCCGSAGIYNLVQPEAADELGRRKAANIAMTGASAVATGNPGCLLQLRRYLDLPLLHPVELLDASIRGVNPLA
jgi:glycolate oxidase iron-sulfur subunit